MSNVNVSKASSINGIDEVEYKGISRVFQLDNPNDTDESLIVLYMYVLPKFPTHGIKVGMTKCRIDETFWHAIKSRIRNQEHEVALPESQYEKYGLEREVIYWGICLDAQSESFKDYKVHDEITSTCAGLVEKEQEWFTNVPQDELVEAFDKVHQDASTSTEEQQKHQNDSVQYL